MFITLLKYYIYPVWSGNKIDFLVWILCSVYSMVVVQSVGMLFGIPNFS